MKTIFDVLGLDRKYPDSTFIIDLTDENELRKTYRKLETENKYLGVFSELTIYCFKGSNSKNFKLSCYSYEFNKYDLPDIIEKVYSIYGKDDSGQGLYTRADSEAIDNDLWTGRSWDAEKHPVACSINYSEEEGLSLTLWDADGSLSQTE